MSAARRKGKKAPSKAPVDKPPYRVPLMTEIEAIPWNGYTVASTFSGTGGSCLGYRMAGFRVLWANEFTPSAQESYKLNHPDSLLDTRDIRKVDPAEILEAIGLASGELDIFDGSPPCDSFSMSGSRDKAWGKEKRYGKGKQRTDDLFFEYSRLLEGLKPKIFVAENVSGLVKGKAKGYFQIIMRDLKSKGYRVKARLLDAQWLGVPQLRQRIIFVGVREDLVNLDGEPLMPAHPPPLPYRYTIRDAMPWIDGDSDDYEVRFKSDGHGYEIGDRPAPTIQATPGGGAYSNHRFEMESGDSSIDGTTIAKEWDKLAPGQQSDKYFNLVKTHPEKPCPTVTKTGGDHRGTATVTHPFERRKFTIAELRRLSGFPDDFKLAGSYGEQWYRLGYSVPPVMMAAIASTVRDEVLGRMKLKGNR